MSISSVNSGGSAMMMRGMPRPDPSKMAEDLFSKLDTKGQGYIEKSDLETALGSVSQSGGSSSSSVADEMFAKLDGDGDGKVTKEEMSATIQKIAAELDGPAPRARMQGGMPPPPPSGGAHGAGSTDSTASSSESSDPADANGDGTVTIEESLAYEASQASSGADTASSATSDAEAELMQMAAGGMPPPKDGGPNDQGFTKDQLTSMVQELGSKDSERAKVMSDIADNFDAADTDGDGKVNASEARTFEESKNAPGTGASSSASSADAQFMKQMMQLLHAYSDPNQTAESSGFSTSA